MINDYAKIENNVVTNVIVCTDEAIASLGGFYIKVTDDTNPASIGCEYVLEKNKFKLPKPYESWTLNEDSLIWEAPVAKPDGATLWSEEDQSWIIPE